MVFQILTEPQLIAAFCIAFFAGTVKGTVGFALPMILMSGLGSFLSPEIALAGLILPTVASNLLQAISHGISSVWRSLLDFRIFLLGFTITLFISAELVQAIPDWAFYTGLGALITLFGVTQLSGWQPNSLRYRTKGSDVLFGALSGFLGGLSGTWGPTTVSYLTMTGTQKSDQMRIQGVIYGVGAMLLLTAHIKSGVLAEDTWSFSILLVLPTLVGMLIGLRINARIRQRTFRNLTLGILIITGANLVRRGLDIGLM